MNRTTPDATRRHFLRTAAAAGCWTWGAPAAARGPNERPLIAFIGTGLRWEQLVPAALKYADCVAVCDVDADRRAKARATVMALQAKKGRAAEVAVYENYLDLLDKQPGVQAVVIAAPDHWHAKMSIDAMKHGRDVYCEKPLTLTIDEGKQIIKVLEATKRVFQVGTQQRSEFTANGGRVAQPFLVAVALARSGRLGKLKRVECRVERGFASQEVPLAPVPKALNWDLWTGPAPERVYRRGGFADPRKRWPATRGHHEFRWWYEYSGGKLTDWGAHHVDIATWAIGMEASGPTSVEGTATHPVPLVKGMPTDEGRYNTATEFAVTAKYPNGVELLVTSEGGNGILIAGEDGEVFVSRSELRARPADDLAARPLPAGTIEALYKGKQPGDHLRNFFACCGERTQPVSDVPTHHRALTTCHLANIAIRLGRKLRWDADTQEIVGDPEARAWQAREQRKGFETVT